MEPEKFNEFISDLIEYYKSSMENISKSVEGLAKIQEKHPEAYEEFQKIAENPELLLGLEIDDKMKAIFFELLLKSSSLTQKINKLIVLTPTEKKLLAKDLREYVQELSTKIEELKKK